METEVWPGLLLEAQRRGVPMILANARLSARSARKGERLDALLRPAVESLALVLAQSADDSLRLRRAGAPDVAVAGNLKFDMTPDAARLARGWPGARRSAATCCWPPSRAKAKRQRSSRRGVACRRRDRCC